MDAEGLHEGESQGSEKERGCPQPQRLRFLEKARTNALAHWQSDALRLETAALREGSTPVGSCGNHTSLHAMSKRFQERNQGIPIRFRHGAEFFARGLSFATMPKDGLGEVARATIVEQERMTVDFRDQADAPKRRGAPVTTAGPEYRTIVGQPFAQVMQQQIRVRPDGLMRQFRKIGGLAGS